MRWYVTVISHLGPFLICRALGENPTQASRQSSISYSRAEEELMASIEQEYGH